MQPRIRLFALGVAAVLALAGCQGGDSNPTGPNTTAENTAGVFRGNIAGDAGTFEFTSVVDAGATIPPPGPFLIRGHDTSYDAELGALVVELTVVNAGPRAYPEPVSLTFLQLLPPGVEVLNADNDEAGIGAVFQFDFSGDDAQWAPGEESLPRTVQFRVPAGVSIGFAARIDVGMDPLRGAIGGLVWRDGDEDGIIDPEEPGIGGVELRIQAVGDPHWLVTTAVDGIYRLDDLPAGYYTVTLLSGPGLRPTTPPQLQILLVEHEGGVSSFLAANFGCRSTDQPEPIQVGDCVHVKGVYAADPHRLIASIYCFCEFDDGGDHDEDKDGGAACWDRLTGPVTGVNAEQRAVAIMGTWMHVDAEADFDPGDLAVGNRVRANVSVLYEDDGHHLEACRLHGFNGHFDRIRGVVQAVFPDADGYVTRVRVLDTMVILDDAVLDCDD